MESPLSNARCHSDASRSDRRGEGHFDCARELEEKYNRAGAIQRELLIQPDNADLRHEAPLS